MKKSQPSKGTIKLANSYPSQPDIVWLDGYLHLPSNSRLSANTDPAKCDEAGQPPILGTVFLDRDGVLVEDVHFLREAAQLRLLPGVTEAVRALQDQFYIVVATNQSGIARGLLTERDLLAIHSALVGQLWAEGVVIDALYYCPHLPEAAMRSYNLKCDCRKPSPGMLLRAKDQWGIKLENSYMIGDKPRDIEAGRQAGASCILIGERMGIVSQEIPVAANLADAANTVLAGRTAGRTNEQLTAG